MQDKRKVHLAKSNPVQILVLVVRSYNEFMHLVVSANFYVVWLLAALTSAS